jgi:hypothetical protein
VSQINFTQRRRDAEKKKNAGSGNELFLTKAFTDELLTLVWSKSRLAPKPDKPEPKKAGLPGNYKIQNTNYKQSCALRGRGASPIKEFKRLRRRTKSGVFKSDPAVCTFGHCNLEFVCIL